MSDLKEIGQDKHTGRVNAYFPGYEYHTSVNGNTGMKRKAGLGNNLRFYYGFLKVLLRGRRMSKKGVYDTDAWARSSFDMFRLIESCGGNFHITGMDKIARANPPVVFISNHMSTLETMVFPCIIAPFMDTTFIVKESLVKHFLFGPIMRSRDPVVVSRRDPRNDFLTVMERGEAILKSGRSIIIFPQSTRKAGFYPEEFNTLGVKLAKKTGCQAIPVAIRTDFWENGKYIKDIGALVPEREIYMDFGEAFSVRGSGKDEHVAVVEFIRERLEKWGKSF